MRQLEAEMKLMFVEVVGFRKELQPSYFLGMENITSFLILFPLCVCYLREIAILQRCFQNGALFKSVCVTI